MSVVACPSCGSGTRADAQFCWLCGASMSAAAVAPAAAPVAAPAAPAPAPVAPQQSSGSGCLWIGGIIVSTIVLLFVGLEIGILAPGLLIPYAVVMVPIMLVFGRMMYIQLFRKQPPPAAPGQQLSARGDVVRQGDSNMDTGTKVATGIAMGLAGVAAIVGIMLLIFIAAIVILFIVCLAAYQ